MELIKYKWCKMLSPFQYNSSIFNNFESLLNSEIPSNSKNIWLLFQMWDIILNLYILHTCLKLKALLLLKTAFDSSSSATKYCQADVCVLNLFMLLIVARLLQILTTYIAFRQACLHKKNILLIANLKFWYI